MVSSVTSLTGNGLKDWLIQRVSAVYFAVYSLFILGYLCFHFPLQYESWHQLFQCWVMKIATIMAVLAIFFHSWVGMWTVFTDYIKCSVLRLLAELLVLAIILGELIWCLFVVGGL